MVVLSETDEHDEEERDKGNKEKRKGLGKMSRAVRRIVLK